MGASNTMEHSGTFSVHFGPSESAGVIATALKPHPLHSMPYLVVSDDRLMMMEIRMESHPGGMKALSTQTDSSPL